MGFLMEFPIELFSKSFDFLVKKEDCRRIK